MKGRIKAILAVLAVASCLATRSSAIPVVNISDVTGPVSVTGSGFMSFTSGLINGNPEAIWWLGAVNPLSGGLSVTSGSGAWTKPGSSQISDVYAIFTGGLLAGGIFISDPKNLPSTFTIPGGPTIDLTKLGIATPETGLPTQISPNGRQLSVIATSSVPDGGSTSLLLGMGLLAAATFRRFLPARTPARATRS
jgi:hypothetical protein